MRHVWLLSSSIKGKVFLVIAMGLARASRGSDLSVYNTQCICFPVRGTTRSSTKRHVVVIDSLRDEVDLEVDSLEKQGSLPLPLTPRVFSTVNFNDPSPNSMRL